MDTSKTGFNHRGHREHGVKSGFLSELRALCGEGRLCRFVKQLAADQHAADLAGAGADFVEFGVT
ncbi:MAG: hypothetical protein R3292_01580, partial [Alcanivorax sp.]|nr:hypothetical protein [Alcanivorax sp.]